MYMLQKFGVWAAGSGRREGCWMGRRVGNAQMLTGRGCKPEYRQGALLAIRWSCYRHPQVADSLLCLDRRSRRRRRLHGCHLQITVPYSQTYGTQHAPMCQKSKLRLTPSQRLSSHRIGIRLSLSDGASTRQSR